MNTGKYNTILHKDRKSGDDGKERRKKEAGESRLSKSFKNSLIYNAISRFGKIDDDADESFIIGKVKNVGIVERFLRPLKFKIAAERDGSVLSRLYDTFAEKFFSGTLGSYATMFMIYGIVCLFITLSKALINYGSFFRADITNVLTETVVILLSLVLYGGSGKSLSEALLGSRIMSYVLFSMLGFPEDSISKHKAKKSNFLIPMLFGIVLGLLTILFSPLKILEWLLIIVVGLIVMRVPEAGVIITLAILPFCGEKAPLLLTILTFLCFLMKVIVGKRSFKFHVTDLCVIVFALLNLFSGMVQAGNNEGQTIAWYIASFVLVSLMIKTEAWITRSINAMCFSTSALSVFICIATFFRHLNANVDNYFVDNIAELLPDTFLGASHIGVFILIGFSSIIAVGQREGNSKLKPVMRILLFFSVMAAVFVGNALVWLGMLAGLVFYFVGKKGINIIPVLVIAGAAIVALVLMPSEYLSKISEYTGINGDNIKAVVGNVSAVLGVALQNIISSVGISSTSFAVLQTRNLAAETLFIENGGGIFFVTAAKTGLFSLIVLVFIFLTVMGSYLRRLRKPYSDKGLAEAGSAGILMLFSCCVTGLFYNIFANPMHLLFFWMFLGLVYSSCNVQKDKQSDCESDFPPTAYSAILRSNGISFNAIAEDESYTKAATDGGEKAGFDKNERSNVKRIYKIKGGRQK